VRQTLSAGLYLETDSGALTARTKVHEEGGKWFKGGSRTKVVRVDRQRESGKGTRRERVRKAVPPTREGPQQKPKGCSWKPLKRRLKGGGEVGPGDKGVGFGGRRGEQRTGNHTARRVKEKKLAEKPILEKKHGAASTHQGGEDK